MIYRVPPATADGPLRPARQNRATRLVRSLLIVVCLVASPFAINRSQADDELPDAKPTPRMQAVPWPLQQTSLQRDGQEIARYWFDASLPRPFVFPIIGPSGRSVTRMAHPRDPNGHSHHNSFWVAHNSVNGVNFWADNGDGRIVHQKVEAYEDADHESLIAVSNSWQNREGKKLLHERREMRFVPADNGQWWLYLDMTLTPVSDPVTFDKSSFGLVAVRMAKTIGVHDGGGRIRNSEGKLNEPEVHWQRAKWVDYSGPIAPDAREGITLMDHPGNRSHPTYFHVRNDGWMGTSLSFEGPVTVNKDAPLRLRYALWVHQGVPEVATIESRFREFAAK